MLHGHIRKPRTQLVQMRANIKEGVVHSPYADSPPLDGTSTYAFLMKRLLGHGSKTAAICGHDQVTYVELLDRLRCCAAGLRSEGIGQGARVFGLVGNSINNLIALCSIPMTGASLVTCDWLLPEDEILKRVTRSSSTHVLSDAGHAGLFSAAKERCKIQDLLLVDESRAGFKSISTFRAENKLPQEQDLDFTSSDCHFVSWTTGTTGEPKCVNIPESRFLRQIVSREVAEVLAFDDVFLGDSNISFYFTFSMWFLALCVGSTIVISKTGDTVATDTFDIIENCKSVFMVTSPLRLRRILNAIKTSGNSCRGLQKSLKKLLLHGASITPAFVEDLTRTFQLKELRSPYGMSEVGGFLTFPPRGEICGINAGFPVSATKMMVTDTTSGKVLGPMERGEVLINSPYVGSSYNADLGTTSDLTDGQGWIHTGDIGYYDEDGRLFLCGRLKTMIKSQQRVVMPSEIEQCLLEHSAVQEVAVLGVPTADFDEAPTAIVVPKSGHFPDERLAEDLKSYVAERMLACKHLRGGVYFADALPETSMGKFRRTALWELLATLHRMDRPAGCTPEWKF